MHLSFIGASLLLVLPVAFTRGCSAGDKAKEVVTAAAYPPHDTLQKMLPDGIELWADLYRLPLTGNEATEGGKPVLVCMHMTGSSRGEYGRFAAEMMALGLNVMSVDLRCGGEGEIADRKTGKRTGVMNETWKQAKAKLGHNPSYLDAYPDVAAAVAWAKELFPYSRVGLVGSSYSASLALVYATENPSSIDAVVAMSPGEYMAPWVIAQRIANLTVPAYITCGNTAADMNQAQPVAAGILDQTKVRKFWPEEHNIVGDHGSRTLAIGGEVNHRRQWSEFEQGIAKVFVPLSRAELERRRKALEKR
jgi:pimeloyl-ACP methyl ester carboxylesterase